MSTHNKAIPLLTNCFYDNLNRHKLILYMYTKNNFLLMIKRHVVSKWEEDEYKMKAECM